MISRAVRTASVAAAVGAQNQTRRAGDACLLQDVSPIGVAMYGRQALAAESAVAVDIHLDHRRLNSALLQDTEHHLSDRSVSHNHSAMGRGTLLSILGCGMNSGECLSV